MVGEARQIDSTNLTLIWLLTRELLLHQNKSHAVVKSDVTALGVMEFGPEQQTRDPQNVHP